MGCIAPGTERVPLIEPGEQYPTACDPRQNSEHCVYPCLDHKTLLDVLDPHYTWRYYAFSPSDIWEAPSAVKDVCKPSPQMPNGITCLNPEWQANVVFPLPADKARIMTDIEDCAHDFPNVAWVIPDGRWSDHPGNKSGSGPSGHDAGPSWVAHIVNAVGNSTCTGDTHPNWTNTVILIVWDDWGGFYDHVSPHQDAGGPGVGYSNGSGGSKQYVHGFRVPLLVVSRYTKQTNPTGEYRGYISGPQSNPDCAHNNYCHDFGSILNFVEYTFGLGTFGDNISDYADALAPDAYPTCTDRNLCPYSLSDFFNFTAPHAFVPITGWKYDEPCFHADVRSTQCLGPNSLDADPDDDAGEDD